MIEGLRSEFPSATGWVTRLRRPAVGREPVGWALLSALGAGFIVAAIVRIALLSIYPALFPATEPHPGWLTPFLIAGVAGGVAAGAVALRAGGIAAIAAYITYELLGMLAAFPGRALFCERSGGLPPDLPNVVACDLTSVVTEHWPIWLAIALGMLAARLLASRPADGNWLLRGAGAFALVTSASGNATGLIVTVTGGNANTMLLNVLFILIDAVAGIAAGLLLARVRLPGALLVALLIVAPTLAFTLPLAVREGFPAEPLEFTVAKWEGVLIPVFAAATLLASRAYIRGRGTIS